MEPMIVLIFGILSIVTGTHAAPTGPAAAIGAAVAAAAVPVLKEVGKEIIKAAGPVVRDAVVSAVRGKIQRLGTNTESPLVGGSGESYVKCGGVGSLSNSQDWLYTAPDRRERYIIRGMYLRHEDDGVTQQVFSVTGYDYNNVLRACKARNPQLPRPIAGGHFDHWHNFLVRECQLITPMTPLTLDEEGKPLCPRHGTRRRHPSRQLDDEESEEASQHSRRRRPNSDRDTPRRRRPTSGRNPQRRRRPDSYEEQPRRRRPDSYEEQPRRRQPDSNEERDTQWTRPPAPPLHSEEEPL